MSELLNIGVALSYSRLLILPAAIVGVVTDNAYLASGAVAAAVLTDLADGGLSRMFGQYSQFGKDFDSTVDFVFIHCLFIALYAAGRMEAYQFLVIYAAMLATLTQQLFGAAKGTTGVARTVLGKPVGALEYAFLLLLVAGMLRPLEQAAQAVGPWLFGAIAVLAGPYVVECAVRTGKGAR